jgi:anaerobic magnesium-protoporphyrin IX monomethyl ester cyclase
MLHAKHVRVAYFLQFGYTGETKEDIEKTIQMVKRNEPDDIGISVSYPLPGTVFYEKVKSQLGEKQNWKDSDDLDLMFSGTYSSKFYKDLQRYVHHWFRASLGLKKWRNPSKKIAWRYAFLVPYNFLLSIFLRLKTR